MYSINKISGIIVLVLLSLATPGVNGQGALERYIREAMQNNLVMQQKNISLERSLMALKQSRSWFYPSAGFIGDYTWAEGGRTIDLPIGDLLNPVYNTLNKLTGSNAFPQIENQQVQLMPGNFYDFRFRFEYPILNPDVIYQARIRQQQVYLSEYEIETYRLELTKEMETAYYGYCLATDAVTIYESAMQLVQRNLRLNESLLRNGKGVTAQVLRAESELESIRSKRNEAENLVKNARAWFNFLLNRPLSDSVIYESLPLPPDLGIILRVKPDVEQRSELLALATAGEIRSLQLDLSQRYAIPKVSAFADLGSQAFNWEFSSKSRYLLAGLRLTLPVFSGMRNRIEIADARLAVEHVEKEKELAAKQFSMAATLALHNLSTTAGNLSSSEKQLVSATSYFNLIEKGYTQGINTLIEYMDARNQLTSSEIYVKINRYKLLGAYAELKRETAVSAPAAGN